MTSVTINIVADALDLSTLVALLRKDNAGREVCSARFERSRPSGGQMLVDLLRGIAGVETRLDGGNQIVHVTFPPSLLFAVARVAHGAESAYLVPGLDRVPRAR